MSVVLVKSLTRTDRTEALSFWVLVMHSAIGLLPALWMWRWPSTEAWGWGWGWALMVAFCGTCSHCCFARAMRHAEATVVVPVDFLRVLLAALAGWAAYSEQVGLFAALGVALILAGNLLNLRRPVARP